MTLPLPTYPFLTSASDADQVSLDDATAKLRATLFLPSTDPVVAQWLFTNPHSTFHTDAAIVPPSVFSNALVVRITHDITPHTPPSTSPFADRRAGLQGPKRTYSASMQLLLVPAAQTKDIVLGYAVVMGVPFDEQFYPFASHESFYPRSIMYERFAFCPKQKHMCCVVNDLAPKVMGIIGLDWLDPNKRSRCFFTVPKQQYSFHNLPNKVLAVLKNVEYKLASGRTKWFATRDMTSGEPDDPDASLCSLGAFLENDDKLRSQTGELTDILPGNDGSSRSDGLQVIMDDLSGSRSGNSSSTGEYTAMSHDGQYAAAMTSGETARYSHAMSGPYGGAVSTVAGRNVGSDDGAFDMTSIFSSLINLESSLEGRFFAPQVSREIMNPVTGKIESHTTGEMLASLQLADVKDAQILRDFTAQSYYATALAVTADRLLTFPSQLSSAECVRNLGVGEGLGGGEAPFNAEKACMISKRPRLALKERMLIPKTMPACASHRNVVEGEIPVVIDEEAIRDAKKEAKRRNNRLSAARSNQRRKERMEAQKKELGQLRDRLVMLKEREKRLATENFKLRRQCSMQE